MHVEIINRSKTHSLAIFTPEAEILNIAPGNKAGLLLNQERVTMVACRGIAEEMAERTLRIDDAVHAKLAELGHYLKPHGTQATQTPVTVGGVDIRGRL